MDLGTFEKFAQGYLHATRHDLTPAEIDHLAFSARLMTFECGLRFLTDYLAGDIYFRTHRPNHNLDRCRTQFELLRQMEQDYPTMTQIITTHAQTENHQSKI